MSVDACLDTNVLLYALSKAPEDAGKRARARQLMRSVQFGVSLQVLQEFYNAPRNKARLRISSEDAERLIEALLGGPCIETDIKIFQNARRIVETTGIRYWDAAVVASAAALGATILYSEDLNAGQVYAGVTVVNPFVGA